MILFPALMLAVALRLIGPRPPRGTEAQRSAARAMLADRSWSAALLAEAREYALFDEVVAVLRDPVRRLASEVHARLYQPVWTGLIRPADPAAVWSGARRRPGATLTGESWAACKPFPAPFNDRLAGA